MKGVRAHEIGGPEVLKYEDIPDLRPGPGQALVDIRAIGVNYTDVSSRKGTNPPASFPWTPGREADLGATFEALGRPYAATPLAASILGRKIPEKDTTLGDFLQVDPP